MSRNKINDLNILKQSAILYKENLLNKDIIFVYLKNNKVDYYSVTFKAEHFMHLTGVKTNLNAFHFFYKASNNRLSLTDFQYKDNTTILKLNNLIYAMSLNYYAKMIGEFKHNKMLLYVEKIVGNNNLIMGFDEGETINYPKTLLVGDIRNLTTKSPYRIIGILRKNIAESFYKEFTYIANNIELTRFFSCKKLIQIIDIENIFSKNTQINQKIIKYRNTKNNT